MTHHYDDPDFSYLDYWKNRDYEHQAEIVALNRLLSGSNFPVCADIGGGFGRLEPLLTKFCTRIILVDPSANHRRQARIKLKKNKNIFIMSGSAQKIRLYPQSVNLALLIRVAHHLPDLVPTFTEIHRLLTPGGRFILEFANSQNFKSRFRSLFFGPRIPLTPLEKRSLQNIKKMSIPFVNHHPLAVIKSLRRSGFFVDTVLSVSNFRYQKLKKFLPRHLLLILEYFSQPLLSHVYFGPSLFILSHRVDINPLS
ncbi:MAG: Phosphatidylethanolamine N-methyltransferase [Candidatus Amesbacteria bacterium GW2011_GWB1_47_19]|nr:MAG: Phosphatidylethanolamine N-methyltransferase [Candidatus Amesbacteria bacterium GW2011_GWA1_44_24]KKU31117.1 MAG: Phosphatidylethanolamine N-methyltransferase [Candidatus Amesbacteria bacterium GW2011_GWC1_46_24]KKU67238.1 MAG: Phosphatidylethanolamine N-methyltransferase [Candidatus Amesbacteria bacterium GW2011_GWB1_47_19]OGD05795.1 MAG: hypothetical protein A2379_01580 [Candidatus Amesbacteria bacterium RIFOXYB1_FULL_47_13]HBC72654.1 hypothetical protein [Candidatus Amesbacteria bact